MPSLELIVVLILCFDFALRRCLFRFVDWLVWGWRDVLICEHIWAHVCLMEPPSIPSGSCFLASRAVAVLLLVRLGRLFNMYSYTDCSTCNPSHVLPVLVQVVAGPWPDGRTIISACNFIRMTYDYFKVHLLKLWKSKVKMVPALEDSRHNFGVFMMLLKWISATRTSLVPDELRQMPTRDSWRLHQLFVGEGAINTIWGDADPAKDLLEIFCTCRKFLIGI